MTTRSRPLAPTAAAVPPTRRAEDLRDGGLAEARRRRPRAGRLAPS